MLPLILPMVFLTKNPQSYHVILGQLPLHFCLWRHVKTHHFAGESPFIPCFLNGLQPYALWFSSFLGIRWCKDIWYIYIYIYIYKWKKNIEWRLKTACTLIYIYITYIMHIFANMYTFQYRSIDLSIHLSIYRSIDLIYLFIYSYLSIPIYLYLFLSIPIYLFLSIYSYLSNRIYLYNPIYLILSI